MLNILLSFILFSACSQNTNQPESNQNVENNTGTSENKQEVVQNKDNSKAPEQEAAISTEKIITLGGNITETVYALGEGAKLVGVDVSSLYPAEVEALPKVGYYRQISAEGIISLGPTVIIGSDAVGPADALEKIKKVGIPVQVLSSKKTLAGAQERITGIAKLLNKETEGKKLIDNMNAELAKVNKPNTKPKVLFIYARGAGSVNVAGTATSAEEMITLAGGINAVSEYEGYKPINSEAIIAAAPDVILMTARGLESIGGIDAVAKLQGISLTPAGKEKKIIAMDDLLLLGFGPRTGQAVQELATKISK